jgi:transposase-like protein
MLDDDVAAFGSRPLDKKSYPYLWLDATFPKVRQGGRVTSMALMIAIGVTDQGERQILGLALGSQENGADWKEFLTNLVDRGLNGVQLAISDDHLGLKAAIQSVLIGTSWQRCTVHFARNCVAKVAKISQPGVGALVRQIFAQGDRKSASELLRRTADTLSSRFPKVAQQLEEAEEDVLAHMSFPSAHWRQIRSTNGLERLNRELARRFSVVGIFPNRDAVTRLGGSVLIDQDDEWAAADRRYFSQQSMALLLSPKGPLPAISPGQPEPVAIGA